MSIQGHKERALLRRGLLVKEALQRRSLDEYTNARRDIIIEDESQLSLFPKTLFPDPEDLIGNTSTIKNYKEKSKNEKELRFWVGLDGIITKLTTNEQIKLFVNLNTLYDFLKPIHKDNRISFYTIALSILKHPNPTQSLQMVVDYINNPIELDTKGNQRKMSKAEVLDRLKRLRNEIGEIKIDELEGFLKKIRAIEYSLYEKSFVGSNFERLGGWLEFKTDEKFITLLEKIKENLVIEDLPNFTYISNTDHDYTIRNVVKKIVDSITKMKPEDFMSKADLRVLQDLKTDDDTVIIKAGDLIEVKKMSHEKDSYFSEFFAIYKNITPEDQVLKSIYDNVIAGMFKQLNTPKGEEILSHVKSGFAGIMFDNNRLILSKDIELYWSNKGARDCMKEPRLTIRYRLTNPNATIYSYDKVTHSNKLDVVKGYVSKIATKKEICQ